MPADTVPDFQHLPRHVAIIMDGNGRWAQARSLSRSDGHRAGTENVHRIVAECRRLGIGYLTLYAFSSENWNRPKAEIGTLFSLLLEFLRREVPLMMEKGIRLQVIGDVDGLPLAQRTALGLAIKKTSANTAMTLNLALNYGGRAEIVRAVREIVASGIKAEDIDEACISQHLYTADQPDPDLLVRTSGELRLSNYLLFQCAYSEFHFTPVHWPDFDEARLHEALTAYAGRSRRFGKTQEQCNEELEHGS